MILAIDIGNTNIVLGCVEGRRISSVTRVATDPGKTEFEYAVLFRDVLSLGATDISGLEGTVLSSVVPTVTGAVKGAVKLLTGRDALVVGAGVKTGLNIRIDNPAQLGSDLVVGAVAALSLTAPPLIIIDMGTASTFSVLDRKGTFLGGAIVPGVGLSMNALSARSSLLPRVSIEAPRRCVGSNTVECMQSGAVYGTAAMIDGMIERFEAELGGAAAVIATGGLAGCITPYCRRKIRNEPELLLLGLALLWEKNRRTPE